MYKITNIVSNFYNNDLKNKRDWIGSDEGIELDRKSEYNFSYDIKINHMQ